MGFIEKIFGTHSEHELKRIYPIVDHIEALEPEMKQLSDSELKDKTREFKERLDKGETLDDILPEAYAVVREAASRVLGMRHYRVQLIGGIILHQGRIAEMKTGEGKTLVSTLPAYLNALTGQGVHIVTVNDYLAKRDAEWMGQVHEFLGLKVGVVLNSMDNDERREAYNCDITYVTNNELGFDYLRDNMVIYKEQLVQRGLKFAIIDDASNADLDNVTCMMFEQEQASYLVGLAAGYTTESNIVGFVTGAANETMNSFGYGYCAGVLDANPDATILQYNANNFGDASGGKTAVNTMVTKGADVVFHAAGGTGIGVIDGCKENKIWAIGVDSDQSPLAPETILTCALKRVDNACYDATKKTILGTLEGGVETYDLAAGGVDIAPTKDNLSKDVLEKIEKAKKDIIAGDLVVPKNQEEFEEKYGDVYELD